MPLRFTDQQLRDVQSIAAALRPFERPLFLKALAEHLGVVTEPTYGDGDVHRAALAARADVIKEH